MKRILKYMLLSLVMGTAFVSCSRPKVIPDKVLSDIYSDIFVINAYANRANVSREMVLDSINIYEPVFQKYGYSSKDFVHTLNEFSKRKSTRMHDVLDAAIVNLDNRYEMYIKERRYLDFIDSLALAITRSEVHRDSLISVRNLADTTKLLINLPAMRGDYEIVYYYTLDSLDRHKSLQNTFSIYNALNHRLDHRNLRMTANSQRTKQNVRLQASESADSLKIRFANYPPTAPKAKALKPNLTIDSLVVIHTPPIEEARITLYRSLPINSTLIDSIRYGTYPQKDSVTLHILPPIAREERDSLAVEGGEIAVVRD